MTKKTFFSAAAGVVVLVVASGCASTGQVKRVDAGGKDTITTMGMDQKDWNKVSAEVIGPLLDWVNSGNLKASPGKPAMLAISRIVLQTGTHIETDNVVKKIRESLLATGKVATLTTRGIGGTVEDPIADEEKRRARLMGLEPNRPDYTLSGKIIERFNSIGNTKEVVYVFQLSLTKNPDGFSVWEKEAQTDAKTTKQGVFRF